MEHGLSKISYRIKKIEHTQKMKKREYENSLEEMKQSEKRMVEPILNLLEKVYKPDDVGSIQDILTYIDTCTRQNREVIFFYLKSVVKAFLEKLYPGDTRFSQILEKEHAQLEDTGDSDDTMSDVDSSSSSTLRRPEFLPSLYRVVDTKTNRFESIISNLLQHHEFV